MINLEKLVLLIAVMAMCLTHAKAYDNEVWEENNTYYWKINGAQAGSSANLSTAISSCIGNNREVHILTSGTLTSTLTIRSTNVKLYGHDNTLTCNFTGSGIINNGNNGFEIHDLTLRNVVGGYGIRCSGASDLSFVNVRVIDIGWIGIRIDSRSSNPWNYTIYNLYMRDCRFENTGSHGLETYGIDGINLEGTMTARNNGECGVLLNQTRNGTIDVVDAYNSAWGTGYAGLRYANACENITTDQLYADRCGRGFFLVQSGPTVNCHVNYAEVRECSNIGIWIENGTNCSVKAGCSESGVSVSGSGSYANVSQNCEDVVVPVSLEEGYYQISAAHTNMCLENNTPLTQENCTESGSQYWEVMKVEDGYQIKSVASGNYMSGGNNTQEGDAGMSTTPVTLALKTAPNGNYYISPVENESLVFDVYAISQDAGERLILWENTGATNQHFSFTSVDIPVDCNGDVNGLAYLDACDVCVGGNSPNLACTGSLEAEEVCDVDGIASENTNTGFTGSGYVNTSNAIGAYATWGVNSTEAQTATISFRFANGSNTSRDGVVSINGTEAGNLILPPTGAWTTWETAAVAVVLEEGYNEVTLSATTDGGLANIDKVSFSNGVTDAQCGLITALTTIAQESITAYPSPTSGILYLNTNEEVSWELYNQIGQPIQTGKSTQLDLSNETKGVYLLKVNGQMFKVVKQ